MTLTDINKRITFLTSASAGTSGQFTDADRLISINTFYDSIHVLIMGSHDEWDFDDKNQTTDFPILRTDLLSGQQDYSLPTGTDDDTVKIKRLELTYDGSSWNRASPLDINEYGKAKTETSNISNDFSTEAPFYDMQYNSVFLYPIPTGDVAKGLKIWIDRSMQQFTSSDMTEGTKKPGFDRQFHDLIPMKVSYDYIMTKKKDKSGADRLERQIERMEQKLVDWYGKKQDDREMAMGGANTDILNYS